MAEKPIGAQVVIDYIRALRTSFSLKPVRIMVLKDLGSISIDGTNIELRKGVEIEVPRWLAQTLAEHGYVELVESPMTLQDIARVHFATMSSRSPADMEPLPKDFFNLVRIYYLALTNRLRKEFDSSLLEERSKASIYLSEIVNKRIMFVLQVLRSPALFAEIYQKLSPEEQVLLENLHKMLEAWRAELLNFLETR